MNSNPIHNYGQSIDVSGLFNGSPTEKELAENEMFRKCGENIRNRIIEIETRFGVSHQPLNLTIMPVRRKFYE